MKPFAFVVFDGTGLSLDPHAPGRRLRIDPRCVKGEHVRGAFAHFCALPDKSAALRTTSPRSSRPVATRSPGGYRCSATTSSA